LGNKNHKQMKKLIVPALGFIILLNSGCGTVFGGRISDCQKHRPTDGSKRELRPAAMVFDIICPAPGLSLLIDFCTGGIYRPCDKKTTK
jgi:hypothetical protein